MPKSLAYIFFILISCLVSAQNTSDSFQMPIYPTCDKITDNQERLNCFQSNIISIYTKQLQKYLNSFEYLNISEAEAKIVLELDNEGKFFLKEVNSSIPLFKGYNELAFKGFKQYLDDNSIHITPAKTLDGKENIGMLISFPIGFKLNDFVEEGNNTRLVSVLHEEDNIYKIYLTPTKELKVYQNGEIKPLYLGAYETIQELKNTLPYHVLISDAGELITLVQADFGKVKMLLQTLNIFNEDEFYTVFIISEVKGRKIKQLRKFMSFEEFRKSPYYNWLIKEE